MLLDRVKHLESKPKKIIAFAFVLLLMVRLQIQIALYQSGFISLTADEFGRTIVAARWSQHPVLMDSGSWLPLYSVFIGTALRFIWELLWVPRVLTILSGIVVLLAMYRIAAILFDSNLVGLLSAFLLSVNPIYNWLAGTSLTEMPNAMLIFLAAWAFILYIKTQRLGDLFLSACSLALANGLRYESWIFSVLFSLTIVGEWVFALIKRKIQSGNKIMPLIAAAIPWIVPIAWMVGNYVRSGDMLYFARAVQAYNQKWYASDISYAKYAETFLKIDPYMTYLGIIAILVCIVLNKKNHAIQWYVAIATIPLAVDIILQSGKSEPAGNYIRYLALFAFLFYPAIGYLLVTIIRVIRIKPLKLFLLVFLGVVAFTQLRATFRFANDPAAPGLAVGLAIRDLRAQDPEIADQPVIIELTYWQYLAIKVGANDLTRVVYDRVLDTVNRQTQSLLVADGALFQSCLKRYQVSYVIVKDSALRGVLEGKLGLKYTREVNGYAFYPIPAAWLANIQVDEAGAQCPLAYLSD